uniref:Uncharacterized protein n=1 Tax=Taeniopygia guttata TaxID=59729 RepID=A0A674GQU7_TAEGU
MSRIKNELFYSVRGRAQRQLKAQQSGSDCLQPLPASASSWEEDTGPQEKVQRACVTLRTPSMWRDCLTDGVQWVVVK